MNEIPTDLLLVIVSFLENPSVLLRVSKIFYTQDTLRRVLLLARRIVSISGSGGTLIIDRSSDLPRLFYPTYDELHKYHTEYQEPKLVPYGVITQQKNSCYFESYVMEDNKIERRGKSYSVYGGSGSSYSTMSYTWKLRAALPNEVAHIQLDAISYKRVLNVIRSKLIGLASGLSIDVVLDPVVVDKLTVDYFNQQYESITPDDGKLGFLCMMCDVLAIDDRDDIKDKVVKRLC